MTKTKTLFSMLVLSVLVMSVGCQSTYYNAMEKIGYEKRDLLVSRVTDVKKSHGKAKKEFESAHEEFAALVNFEGGDLEKKYNQLKKRYEKSVDRAEDIKSKRERVESVGKALFKEWKMEIAQYKNASLKSQSMRQFGETEQQFKRLVAQLKSTEARIVPVLEPFQDRVLFLKHNLNARSVVAMRDENVRIQKDIRSLVKDMQLAIEEADELIQQMGM